MHWLCNLLPTLAALASSAAARVAAAVTGLLAALQAHNAKSAAAAAKSNAASRGGAAVVAKPAARQGQQAAAASSAYRASRSHVASLEREVQPREAVTAAASGSPTRIGAHGRGSTLEDSHEDAAAPIASSRQQSYGTATVAATAVASAAVAAGARYSYDEQQHRGSGYGAAEQHGYQGAHDAPFGTATGDSDGLNASSRAVASGDYDQRAPRRASAAGTATMQRPPAPAPPPPQPRGAAEALEEDDQEPLLEGRHRGDGSLTEDELRAHLAGLEAAMWDSEPPKQGPDAKRILMCAVGAVRAGCVPAAYLS